ncbi:DNA-binding response regulator [Paenibacillus marchantiophytorum]|uniref:DNA-binding response regulator n=1 Tax=Paenibacillus marchantiophytorum TaxID=1619310 RepID=A0ABQ2BS91_9BACL|nr:response regulator [Paenibacillus marchantiophytorum]GGI46405.1 DNA-binding response regulator [Paenibacillus marchantiophytorum]
MHKVLIVDDERAIRLGLVNFVAWASADCEVVGEAINGLEAIEKIQELAPEIIVTDVKMPGMNGIELAKYIHEKVLPIKVIILTGYTDFSYAQAALKYNVVDFVLKPTEPVQLIAAVTKAKAQLLAAVEVDYSLSLLKNKIIDYSEALREKFIKDVFDGVIKTNSAIADKANELELNLTSYYVLLFEIHNTNAEDIKQLISLAFKDYTFYTVCLKESQLGTLISFKDENSYLLFELCSEILRTLEGFISAPISIGISNPHLNIMELKTAYEETSISLTSRFYNKTENSLCIYSNYVNSLCHEEKFSTNTSVENILDEIKVGNGPEFSRLISELFEQLRATKQPIDYIKNTGINLCFAFQALLSNYNLSFSSFTKEEQPIYKQIVACTSALKLSQLIVELASEVSIKLAIITKQNNLIIIKTMRYINENYKSSITLKILSDYVHTNSSYLSRLFKKETGDTVTKTINKVRLEKAKELLSTTDLKTYEVAEEVGIPDPSYFSIIFKKYTGVSPKDYSRR